MCELSKWVAIASGIPITAAMTIYLGLWTYEERVRLGNRLAPYTRWLLLDLVFFILALATYAAHCT